MTSKSIYSSESISAKDIAEFEPTYLYVKLHTISNILYLGKTTKNPIKYLGSGKLWAKHIKKYGSENIENIFLELYDDIYELHFTSLLLSSLYDVVLSNEWANLMIENGLTGAPKGTFQNSSKNKIWVHDIHGNNKMVYKENIPDGFIPGRYYTSEKLKLMINSSKGKPQSIETAAKSAATRTGKNNRNFLGYYVTPEYTTDTRKRLNESGFRKMWCKNSNKFIKKSSYTNSKYLSENFLWEFLKNKTFADIGFGFIPKEEYNEISQ